MRINYNILFFWCLYTIALPGYTQQPDSSFTFLDNAYDHKWQPKSIKMEAEALIGSNSLNTKMFSDVLLRSDFTPTAKQQFLDGAQDQTRIYTHLVAKGEYKLDSNYGVYVKYKQIAGLLVNKDFSEMLLFGNSAFKDQKVVSNELDFIQTSTAALGFTKKGIVRDNWSSKIGIGINFVLDLRQVYAENASLFTEANADYLDVELKNVSYSKKSSGLKGIGFDLDYDCVYVLNTQNTFGLKVYDLNFNYLINQKSVYLDTSFRFDGYHYDLFNDSASLTEYLDTSFNNIEERGTKTRKWASLPSRVYMNWNRKLNNKTALVTEFYAIDLSAYGVGGSLGVKRKMSTDLMIMSSIGYGNYTGIAWRLAAEYRIAQSWNIYLNAQGLNAFAIPEISKNYGLSLGFSKHL